MDRKILLILYFTKFPINYLLGFPIISFDGVNAKLRFCMHVIMISENWTGNGEVPEVRLTLKSVIGGDYRVSWSPQPAWVGSCALYFLTRMLS